MRVVVTRYGQQRRQRSQRGRHVREPISIDRYLLQFRAKASEIGVQHCEVVATAAENL